MELPRVCTHPLSSAEHREIIIRCQATVITNYQCSHYLRVEDQTDTVMKSKINVCIDDDDE